MTREEEVSKRESTPKSPRRRRRKYLNGLVFTSAALGAVVTLVTIWSLGPSVPANDGLSSLHAGFGSNTMTIIDQVGTVDVELWVKNESGASVSATCAVIVTSGTVHELYRGSAAFSLVSIEPHSSRHLLEGVTGVYLDGDATGPIGPRYLPLPQYAKNARGSAVDCL